MYASVMKNITAYESYGNVLIFYMMHGIGVRVLRCLYLQQKQSNEHSSTRKPFERIHSNRIKLYSSV